MSKLIRLKQIEPIKLVGRFGPTGSETGPSDGTYGQFNSPGLLDGDLMEDAFDKIINIMDALVPPQAPSLTSMSYNSGVSGQLSFGTSNPIANYNEHPTIDATENYVVSGNTRGLFDATTNFTGTLANNVSADTGTPNPAYPANAFGNADKGTLELKLDGVTLLSVDLTTYVSGATANGNGSGFNLSVATSVVFPQGSPFENFKYRTGTFTIDASEFTSDYGYHTAQVVHTVGSKVNSTQTYNFAIDDYTPSLVFSAESLSGLVMSGSRFISGVEYHQSGTASYTVTADNVYKNSYSLSSTAISHPTTTNCSVPSTAVPDFTVDENDTLVITKIATVDNSNVRILNAGLTVDTRIDRTVQADQTSVGTSNFTLLLDTITTGNTNTFETFNNETWRINEAIESNLDTVLGYGSGGTSPAALDWDSTQSLLGGADYNNSLLFYNGALRYPTNAPNSGDFSSVTNGPSGNVDYSTATGERVFYRQYYIQSKQNFVMQVQASSTTFVAATNIGTLSGNNVAIELLAPSQTSNGSSTEWKDCTVSYTTDNAIGCYSSSQGSNVGSITGQNWGLTIGTKSTASSGDVIILKITAPASWSGQINSIQIVGV